MLHGAIQDFPLTLDRILDHAAKWHGEVEVVTAREGAPALRIGYADLRAQARRVSAVLTALDVQQGEHVATLSWNTQAHLEAWFGIMGMGAVCHTLNPRLTATQLGWMLGQSEARVLMVGADLAPLARAVAAEAPALRHVLVIDGDGDGDGDDDDREAEGELRLLRPLLAAVGRAPPWGAFPETAPSGLCFTSGSTGAPKGVTYTHRAGFLHTLRLLQADSLALRSADVVMPVVPMFHAHAWGLPFAAAATGARLVLPGRQLDGANLARLIAAEGVTVAIGVPTVWLGLFEHLERTGERLPSLQRIVFGGAPTPPALKARLEGELGVVVQGSWGITELSPVGVLGLLSEPGQAAAISGRPALGVDLMLADESGRPLPEQRGLEGRLHVRGAAVVQRYFGQERAATDADGWFDTGDLARIAPAGDLVITGRAKDLIKSGGEWINPSQIEAIVCALPQVALAAVIGRSDPRWGERPVLLVELRDGQQIADEDLLSALRGRIASWWTPDVVIRLASMPLATTGKIDKAALRSRHGTRP